MIKKIVIIFFFLGTVSTLGQQKNINNYKYIIVPEKFDFLKESNEYQTGSLTKFLLQKNGFIVFLGNEKLPVDLLKDRCLALKANLINSSSLFSTKISITLIDCYGKEVYSSKEGRSKLKDYKKSYHEAIRNAHASMDIKYSYQPNIDNKVIVEDVKPISIPAKTDAPVAVVKLVKETILEKNTDKSKLKETVIKENILYAQSKENGFQLVNTKPEVLFQILNTKNNELFIIKNKNGILYKSKDNWIAEYYENNVLIVKKYQIKF